MKNINSAIMPWPKLTRKISLQLWPQLSSPIQSQLDSQFYPQLLSQIYLQFYFVIDNRITLCDTQRSLHALARNLQITQIQNNVSQIANPLQKRIFYKNIVK